MRYRFIRASKVRPDLSRLRVPLMRLLIAALLVLSALCCYAEPEPVIIGQLVSRSGSFQGESQLLQNGFKMWLEDVTARGGILMADGERHPVVVHQVNDASDPQVAGLQVTDLITNKKVHIVVGPFGAAMAQVAVLTANKTQTPIIYAAASSGVLFTSGYQHAFSIQAQVAKRQEVCVDTFADARLATLELIIANDTFQLGAAASFASLARQRGITVGLNYTYPVDESDFEATRAQWHDKEARPDIVLIGGALPFSIAAIEFVRSIYDPKAIFIANGGSLPGVVANFGWEAEYIFQGVQWDSVLEYTDEYYGNTSNFAAQYRLRFKEEPFYTSAASYTSGYIIEKALESLWNLTNTDIIDAIKALDVECMWGPIKFLGTGELDGRIICEQVIDHSIQIIAPQNLSTAEPVMPAYPPRPPPPRFSQKELLLIKVLTPTLGGLLLIGIIAAIAYYLSRKYYFVTLPKNEASDQWGDN